MHNIKDVEKISHVVLFDCTIASMLPEGLVCSWSRYSSCILVAVSLHRYMQVRLGILHSSWHIMAHCHVIPATAPSSTDGSSSPRWSLRRRASQQTESLLRESEQTTIVQVINGDQVPEVLSYSLSPWAV